MSQDGFACFVGAVLLRILRKEVSLVKSVIKKEKNY
jgi:hypothetical protein